MNLTKKCKVCGNYFIAKSDKAEYCSNACRAFAYRKREKSKMENDFFNEDNELEIFSERINQLEVNQKYISKQFYELVVALGKDFVSTSALNVIITQRNEDFAIISKQAEKIKELEDVTYKLNSEISNLRYDFKGLLREFDILKEEIARNQTGQAFYAQKTSNLEDLAGITNKLLSNDKIIEKIADLIPDRR